MKVKLLHPTLIDSQKLKTILKVQTLNLNSKLELNRITDHLNSYNSISKFATLLQFNCSCIQ